MAQRRGSSAPVSGMANPFWSQRIRAEWDLQAVRPADLPVPEDEETQRQLEQESERQPLGDERGRSKGHTRRGSPRRLATFTTPQSWESGKGVGSAGGLRSAGMMPTSANQEEGDQDGLHGRMSQGPEPGSDQGEDSLQRALEKEVMNQLHEENLKLKQMLSEMQQSKGTGTTSTSEWSEVSGTGGVPEPVRKPQPPREDRKERIMFTPNGTRVPSLPPPLERDGQIGPVGLLDLPPWPVSLWPEYEREDGDRKRLKRLGSEPYRPTGVWKDLPPEPLGRGMDSRQGHQDGSQVAGRGMKSRQELREGVQARGRGINSRQGECQNSTKKIRIEKGGCFKSWSNFSKPWSWKRDPR